MYTVFHSRNVGMIKTPITTKPTKEEAIQAIKDHVGDHSFFFAEDDADGFDAVDVAIQPKGGEIEIYAVEASTPE